MNGYNLFIIISLTFTFLVSVAAILTTFLYDKNANGVNFNKNAKITGDVSATNSSVNNLEVGGNMIIDKMNGNNLLLGDLTVENDGTDLFNRNLSVEGNMNINTPTNTGILSKTALMIGSRQNIYTTSVELLTIGPGFSDGAIFNVMSGATAKFEQGTTFDAGNAVKFVVPEAKTSPCVNGSIGTGPGNSGSNFGKLQYCSNGVWKTLANA